MEERNRMDQQRCVNCMSLKRKDAFFCPHCGFDQRIQEDNPFGLKWNTVLRERYLVGKILGQGGFGITYVGYDTTLDVKVAIKEYFPLGFASRNATVSNRILWNTGQLEENRWKAGCDGFLKEARRMARIDSLPGIVRVRDTFLENETAYIIMDFIEGVNLKQRILKNGPMEAKACLTLLKPLMASLSLVHKQGLIHRDISPDNIMIKPDGRACLLDFGAAKDVSLQQSGVSQPVMKRGFSPLEQYLENGALGPWTDVYAMCATIYYCMTGKMIPEALERSWEDKLSFQGPDLAALPAHVSASLKDGLAVRPEQRIRDMEELIRRLETPAAAVKDEKKAGGKEKKKENKKKFLLAGILLAAVAAASWAALTFLPDLSSPWEYEECNGGIRITAYLGNAAVLEIPSVIRGKDVVEVDESVLSGRNLEEIWTEEENTAFESRDGVLFSKDGKTLIAVPRDYSQRHYKVPEGVEKIGERAFARCDNLISVSLPSTAEIIEAEAFADCSKLEEVEIPRSVKEVGDYAFDGCSSLAEVTLSGSCIIGSDTVEKMALDGIELKCYVNRLMTDIHMGISVPAILTGAPEELKSSMIHSVTFLDTLEDMPQDAWDVSEDGDGTVMAWVLPYEDETGARALYIGGEGGVTAASCENLFFNYVNLQEISFNDCFYTNEVTSMTYMFNQCKSLAAVDMSGLDTSQVTEMYGMFYRCESLTELDLSTFDTSQVTTMGSMFERCISLEELNLKGFDINQVNDMESMFRNCESMQKLQVDDWNISHVENLENWMLGVSPYLEVQLLYMEVSSGLEATDTTETTDTTEDTEETEPTDTTLPKFNGIG